MRDRSIEFVTACQDAAEKGFVPRIAVFFSARNRANGAVETLGLWTGSEDRTLVVKRPSDGVAETRAYYGGKIKSIGEIERRSDMDVRTATITLHHIKDAATLLVRTYDVRNAPVEIHEVLFDPQTGAQIVGEIEFEGIVAEAPIRTPRKGEEGAITIKAVSRVMADLARTNPAKASYEEQKKRSGDEWNLYAGVVESWQLPWGRSA